MSSTFRSFSVFNYRVWFIGALVSNVGAWMQATGVSWHGGRLFSDPPSGPGTTFRFVLPRTSDPG